MSESNELIYKIEPKEFTKFGKVLKDIDQYIQTRATKENLIIVDIRVIYYPETNIAYKLKIEFARAIDPDGQTYSENLSEPIEATIKRIFADFLQKSLDKNKTSEDYEETIKPLYEEDNAITINGEPVDLSELQIQAPVEKPKKSKKDDDPIRLESLDFEKPRIIVGGKKIPIQPEIGEAIQKVTRAHEWTTIVEQKSLDLEQLKMLLNLVQRAAAEGMKVLEEPGLFYGAEDENN